MDSTTTEAAVALARSAWSRPTADAYLSWRYREAPTQEAVIALAGAECVAKMFVLQRTYRMPGGMRPCLEPFEWYANERWRPAGAGLRVVKRLMADERPIVALGGTALATSLITRLGWTRVCTVGTYMLPLRGTYLRARGWNPWAAGAFDLIGGQYFRPEANTKSPVQLRRTVVPGPSIMDIANRQQRFAWMRMPCARTTGWLGRAPAEVGTFSTNEVLVDGEVVGWASMRTFVAGGVRTGALQEMFLRDDARSLYPEAVRAVSVALAAEGVDVLSCLTSCPDTAAALQGLRFRHDSDEGGFVWNGGDPVADGPALFDGCHADRAFFPIATAVDIASPIVASAS